MNLNSLLILYDLCQRSLVEVIRANISFNNDLMLLQTMFKFSFSILSVLLLLKGKNKHLSQYF